MLVVGPSWVGDTVLAQPLFMRLRERSPQLALDVLAPPWTASLVRRMPEVNDVIENPFRHGELKVFARRRLGLALRERHYHRAIILPNSLKSALPPFFAHIAVRTGYRGELRSGVLNDIRRLDEKRLPLLVERFAALAEPAGAPLRRPVPRPRLRADPLNRSRAIERLQLATERPVVAFCPGAEYGEAKRWPVEHFAALAGHARAAGAQVWLFGSANDKSIADAIASRCDAQGIANLCGRTTLADAVDLLSLAAVVVSNDSGLMHVAAALDRPLVALYGSSSPGYTPPLAPQARVLSLDLPCSPCFERVCPLGHFKCLRDLAPDRVWRDAAAIAAAALPHPSGTSG
ncbi:MAG: lipopolysaccharide heptosyltransferase II [Betaproteobacteria bacterium]|nr:lipopolysaccharide heptosyltransferase II [Betaproteobacteria bacterium]